MAEKKKKTTQKPAVARVANALSESIGRIGSKVKSITGSARDTIITQIDAAIENRRKDLTKELELSERRAAASGYKSTKAYERSARRGETSVLGRSYFQDQLDEGSTTVKVKRDLKNLQAAQSQWNKFKGSISSEGKPKTKKK